MESNWNDTGRERRERGQEREEDGDEEEEEEEGADACQELHNSGCHYTLSFYTKREKERLRPLRSPLCSEHLITQEAFSFVLLKVHVYYRPDPVNPLWLKCRPEPEFNLLL